ncbi:MAG: endonuclease/exonuclease/phosphatase family protein [Haloferula sp.]
MRFRFICFGLLGLLALSPLSCVPMGQHAPLGSFQGQQEVAENESPAHFICWNVHKASDAVFTEDVRELLDAIPEKNKVTMCLQEVRSTTFDMIKGLHREEVSGHYAPSWRFAFSGQSTGVMTIGNQPLPDSGIKHIRAPRRELYVASPKVSLRSEVPLADGRNLQIVNCHGLNFVPFSVLPDQLEQIFGSLRCSESPAIVCGDFNVWSERRLKLLNRYASQAGLVEAQPRGKAHSPAPKWLGWLNRVNGFDPEIRLDRIFTRGVEVLDCYSHDGSESSDHQPLVLSYRVLPKE